MKLIQTSNGITQIVPVNNLIKIGKVDRRICSKNSCYLPTFYNDEDSITLNWIGYYKIDVTLVAETKYNILRINLLLNGNLIHSSQIQESLIQDDIATIHISKIVKVEKGCPQFPTQSLKIQLENVGNGDIAIHTINLSVIKVG